MNKNYHLHHNGKDIGVFTLDQLREQRASGILTGAELAWCPGMAGWTPLDQVLQASASPPGSSGPPALPEAARKTSSKRSTYIVLTLSVLVAVGGGIWLASNFIKGFRLALSGQRGFGANDRSVQIAAKPIKWPEKPVTTTVHRKKDREFRVRQWLEAYEKNGVHNQPWDADAREFLKVWLEYYHGEVGVSNQCPVPLADKLVANAECNDPAILTLAAVTTTENFESIRRMNRAVQAYSMNTTYKAYPQFYARIMLATWHGNKGEVVAGLDATALALFQQMFSDGSLRPEDQDAMGEILVFGWGENFFIRHSEEVCSILEKAGKPYQWLALTLRGEHHKREAWKARGGGYSNTVTAEGWRGFNEHLAKAKKCYGKACDLRPDLALPASRMISVAMGESGAEEMRAWFDRAMSSMVDYQDAWRAMRWGLWPRWHGSHEALLAFGKMALDTGHFETDVPSQYYWSVTDVQTDSELPPGQFLFGREDIWPDMQRMYEGYLKASTTKPQQDNWRSYYTVIAYLAGKYDLAAEQLKHLNWRLPPEPLSGRGLDLSLLPLEVAARTCPAGAKVEQAEKFYQEQNLKQARSAFTELQALVADDALAARFVNHRLAALTVEERLAAGEWVDFLPAKEDDLNWMTWFGKYHRLTNGAIEVASDREGHLLCSRVRVGSNFEIKGEFEVMQSSTRSFQAGIVMGLPDSNTENWYTYRMKRNDDEGQLVMLGAQFKRGRVHRPLTLNDRQNTFTFKLENNLVSSMINEQEILSNEKSTVKAYVAPQNFLVGLGAFNDMNETVIQYRNLKVHRLPAGKN